MRDVSDQDLQAARCALILKDNNAEYHEIASALQWIDQSECNRLALERTDRFLNICEDVFHGESVDEPESDTQRTRWIAAWQPRAIAASLAIVVFAALIAMFGGFRFNAGGGPSTVRYATSVGQIGTVQLSDGSAIALSGASAVSVSFDKSERRLDLEKGEALFTVAPDSKRPFVVKSGIGTTTAIGTAFNIRRQETGATITVVHGVVAVRASGANSVSETRIGPAMQVKYFQDGGISPAHRVDVQSIIAWRDGNLIFSGEPLSEVIRDINRYSSRPILIEDKRMAQIPISGSIRINNIQEWLLGLQKVMNFTVIRNDNSIILRSRSA